MRPAPKERLDAARAEQQAYAHWLAWGARISLALLVVSFLAYLAGLTGSAVPSAEIARVWAMSAAQFTAISGGGRSWFWLEFAQRSDVVSLIGIACVAVVTPVCVVRLAAEFVAQKERAYAAITLLQLIIFIVAASGILVT